MVPRQSRTTLGLMPVQSWHYQLCDVITKRFRWRLGHLGHSPWEEWRPRPLPDTSLTLFGVVWNSVWKTCSYVLENTLNNSCQTCLNMFWNGRLGDLFGNWLRIKIVVLNWWWFSLNISKTWFNTKNQHQTNKPTHNTIQYTHKTIEHEFVKTHTHTYIYIYIYIYIKIKKNIT